MKSRLLSFAFYGILILASGLVTGCGDLLTSTGEEGLISYRLFTDYDMEAYELTETSIVTGHTQRFYTDLTAQGMVEIVDRSQVSHQITPSQGATLNTSLSDYDADFSLLVSIPGDYTIESTVDGETVDQIKLTFVEPEGIELVTRVREPYAVDFSTVSEAMTTTTQEGAQVTFLAIPLDGFGLRLAGDISTNVTFDPDWSVVPGQNINGVYEDGYWALTGPSNFYFIEPGLVTSTVEDPISGAQGQHEFNIHSAVPTE